MAEGDVEALRHVYGRWSTGDFRASLELLAPDIKLVMKATPDPATYRGIEAVRTFMRDFLQQWSHYTIEALELLASGDRVLVTGMQRAVAASTGIRLELATNTVWTFRDGQVVEMLWTLDRGEALTAAGLPSPP